jgi:riboflavin synthase
MFTGIIRSAGKIESLELGIIGDGGAHVREAAGNSGARLRVRFAPELIAVSPLTIGASIAVNGCCLTVIEFGDDFFVADLSPETLARTSFVEKKPGDAVNLERPLRVGDELGGYIVQGHVDGVGRVQTISSIQNGTLVGIEVASGPNTGGDSDIVASSNSGGNSLNDDWWLAVSVPPEIANYIVEKGSLTVDGISLTVANWTNGIAGIAVIPFTYGHTNVRYLSLGDAVNLECDVLAKYVEQALSRPPHPQPASSVSRISLERLLSEGF